MIDDGPFARKWIHRAVKRFDLDMARWPRPPESGGEWDTYWEYRVTEVLSTVGLQIRKLIDVEKLSIEVQAKPLDISFAPIKGNGMPGKINYPDVDRFYDLNGARSVRKSAKEVCNALIHSFVLVPQFSYTRLNGLCLERFFLASDSGRRTGVYIVEWRWFVEEFVQVVCQDDIASGFGLRLRDGEELYIGSCRYGIQRDELIRLYCGISKDNRKRYMRFMERWKAECGDRPVAP